MAASGRRERVCLVISWEMVGLRRFSGQVAVEAVVVVGASPAIEAEVAAVWLTGYGGCVPAVDMMLD